MFVHNNLVYIGANSIIPNTGVYADLTDDELSLVPWPPQGTGCTVGNQTSFVIAATRLSDRFPDCISVWMRPLCPLEDCLTAVCMADHRRLGAASPLRLLDSRMLRGIIEQALL